MHVVATGELLEFSKKHPDARSWVRAWLADARRAIWSTPQDIRERYPTVSFLTGNLVIFNVKGNTYRMVTQVAYRTRVVVIKWIGSHSAYDKVNWETARNETRSS